MSDAPENRPLLDLTELRLVPKWVSEFGKTGSSPIHQETETRARRPQSGDRRPPMRDDRNRGPRNDFRGPRDGARFRDGRAPNAHDRNRRDTPPPQDHPPRIPETLVAEIEPESRAVEAMAVMIRNAGKAYSVFDAARLVLSGGDRYHVKFSFPTDSTAKLYAIPADGSLWLSHEEALTHFLNSDSLNEFYRTEEVELEEPKGNFTSIAVCGLSGELLGPPSHHSYQTTLHKIHRERYSHLSLEDYKRRVRTENTPEIVEKWKASLRHATYWIPITPDAESASEPPAGEEQAPAPAPLRLKSRAEMQAHFRKTYGPTLVHETHFRYVPGNIPRQHLNPALYILLRRTVDETRKHLLPLAQRLCNGFEQNGLKLFKRRGGKLWVSRIRPRLLDNTVVLSERISQMIQLIKSTPGISAKALIEAVAPHLPEPAPAELPPPAPVAASEIPSAADVASLEAPPAALAAETVDEPAATQQQPVASPASHTAHPNTTLTPQMQALKDLHWLNSEGYVIEYADGLVFPGVTEPPPSKPKPAKSAPAAVTVSESPASDDPLAKQADEVTAPESAMPESAETDTGTPAAAEADAIVPEVDVEPVADDLSDIASDIPPDAAPALEPPSASAADPTDQPSSLLHVEPEVQDPVISEAKEVPSSGPVLSSAASEVARS